MSTSSVFVDASTKGDCSESIAGVGLESESEEGCRLRIGGSTGDEERGEGSVGGGSLKLEASREWSASEEAKDVLCDMLVL